MRNWKQELSWADELLRKVPRSLSFETERSNAQLACLGLANRLRLAMTSAAPSIWMIQRLLSLAIDVEARRQYLRVCPITPDPRQRLNMRTAIVNYPLRRVALLMTISVQGRPSHHPSIRTSRFARVQQSPHAVPIRMPSAALVSAQLLLEDGCLDIIVLHHTPPPTEVKMQLGRLLSRIKMQITTCPSRDASRMLGHTPHRPQRRRTQRLAHIAKTHPLRETMARLEHLALTMKVRDMPRPRHLAILVHRLLGSRCVWKVYIRMQGTASHRCQRRRVRLDPLQRRHCPFSHQRPHHGLLCLVRRTDQRR